MPFLVVMFRILFLVPSSIPVNCACSESSSITCILSTISAGKFLVANKGSLPKNSFPSTFTLVTVSPWALILPSLATSTPGTFCNKSSTTAFSRTLIDLASNSRVSFFTTIGMVAVTFTVFKSTPSSLMAISPAFTAALATSTSLVAVFKPKKAA
ncbi:hypothetical protein D3C85_749060 [compost metagenome]